MRGLNKALPVQIDEKGEKAMNIERSDIVLCVPLTIDEVNAR